jgi:transcriptional regulator with XRE-family HTH domain
MTNTAGARSGERRRLAPAEIGNFVLETRTARKIKRQSLARDSNLSEKTIERVESGEGVAHESYRRIASALGVPKDLFTSEMYVPTAEEAVEMLIKAHDEFLCAHVRVEVAQPSGEQGPT